MAYPFFVSSFWGIKKAEADHTVSALFF